MKRLRIFVCFSCTIYATLCLLWIASYFTELEAHTIPDYPRERIDFLLQKEVLEEQDFLTLFYQTGLAPAAVSDLRTLHPSSHFTFLTFQDNLYKKVRYACNSNSIISKEESLFSEDSTAVLAPLRNGDILISSNSHTFFWRNGHAAIVTDAKKGETLESVVLGQNSVYQTIQKWKKYPNFIILRLKNASSKTTEKIAQTAKSHLVDIPYDFTVGILSPKKKLLGQINATQCAHLVWEAYYLNGYDIDSDGGLLVTPTDLLSSNQLEIVQVYGVNPKEYADRF